MYTCGACSDVGWCPRCGPVPVRRPRLRHGYYFALGCFTLGLGFGVWAVEAVRASTWRCAHCGEATWRVGRAALDAILRDGQEDAARQASQAWGQIPAEGANGVTGSGAVGGILPPEWRPIPWGD